MTSHPAICFLTGTLNAFAGAERVTAAIASELAARGYRIHILSLWDRGSCFALHSAITHDALFDRRPSFKRAYLQTVRGIRQYIVRHHVDVLIDVDTMLTLFTLPATFGLPTRRVSWEHCNFDQDLGKPARRLARRLAARFNSRVVVLTERDKARWQSALSHPHNIVAIPNPLPFDLPESPASRLHPTVLAVGRLSQAKGFDILLRAWSEVRHVHPEWKLQIVGEGEERGALEKLRSELGLEPSVSLPGARADIGAAYQDASIFCLSSRYEGFGLVLLEAMAFGLPVVSTACETGPKALLEDGVQAVMVPTDTPQALAQALIQVIGDPQLQQSLAVAGRAMAAGYAIGQIAAQWETLLTVPPSQTDSGTKA